jgi:hypothetical protein
MKVNVRLSYLYYLHIQVMLTNYQQNSNIEKTKCLKLICILKTFTVKQDIINIS